jgi:hypothetical protein
MREVKMVVGWEPKRKDENGNGREEKRMNEKG